MTAVSVFPYGALGKAPAADPNFTGDPFFVFVSDATTAYTARFRLEPDGTAERWNSRDGVISGTVSWLDPADQAAGVGSDYECYLSSSSTFDAGSDAINTWLSLSIARDWSITDPTKDDGAEQGSGTLYVRKNGDASSEISTTMTVSSSWGTF